MSLLHRVRFLARRAGVDISRYPAAFEPANPMHLLVRQLDTHGVNVVLDVGANRGVYGDQLRRAGYEGRIISFEPLREPFSILRSRAAADKQWDVFRYAIGHENGAITLNVAANAGDSSSILPMLSTHVDAAPEACYIGTEHAEIRTLDSLAPEILRTDDKIFLKVDVQGYEKFVIAGAKSTLSDYCVGLQLELSLVPVYEGGMLYREALNIADGLGFSLAGVTPVFANLRTGRMLQIDGIFFAEESGSR